MIIFYSARQTTNGGIVEIGVSNKLNLNCTDPVVVKLNACGEKEWCRIYNASNCNSGGYDIVQVPGGGYMALIDHWTTNQQKLIWLFRLDDLGEIIWSQTYANDPVFVGEWSHSLLMTPDTNFVITAEVYYPDQSLPPNSYILKILHIKAGLDGNAMFTLPWGVNNGVVSDGRLSTTDVNGNIYTSGRRARQTSPGGDSPSLFKTSFNGLPVYYKDLKITSSLGMASTINWFQDSSMAMVAQWKYNSGQDSTGVIKTDLCGNTFVEKIITTNSNCAVYGSDITFNNRLILGGWLYSSNNIQSVAYKLTSDLEYDSVYTRPFTYDSLCPHPIVSDTVPLDDCEVVIVGLDDAEKHPEKTRLNIYPNPAGEQVTIVMPQYLVRQNAGSILSSITTYFQWDKTRLDILSMTGKLMFTHEVPKQQSTLQVNTSAWPAGMYFVRVVYMNESVAEGKIVIE